MTGDVHVVANLFGPKLTEQRFDFGDRIPVCNQQVVCPSVEWEADETYKETCKEKIRDVVHDGIPAA